MYQQIFGDLVMTIDGVERRSISWADWAITTRIDATAHWEQVQRAVACHRSQLPAYQRFAALPPAQQRTLWGNQTFYRALSLVNGGREIEHDLFAGIPDKGVAGHSRWTEPLVNGLVAPEFVTQGMAFN